MQGAPYNNYEKPIFDGVSHNVVDAMQSTYDMMVKAEQERNKKVQRLKVQGVHNSMNGLRLLKSDYFGMETYYYNEASNEIYSVDNVSGTKTKVGIDVGRHLRILNNITAPGNEVANAPWDGVQIGTMTDYNAGSDYNTKYKSLMKTRK